MSKLDKVNFIAKLNAYNTYIDILNNQSYHEVNKSRLYSKINMIYVLSLGKVSL